MPRLLPQRCAQLNADENGFIPPYEAPADENERLLSIALELSRIPAIQHVVDRAGIEKDLTDDEQRLLDQETIAILDRMGWDKPFFYNLIISLAWARRVCAGVIARDDTSACLHYVAERRCEQYHSGLSRQMLGKEPPARLSDWMTSLHYFQSREDLWRPFDEVRQRELRPGELYFRNMHYTKKIFNRINAFAIRESVKHALCAWQVPEFEGVTGWYGTRRIDRFDDEKGISAFIEANSCKKLIDDRGGHGHD